METCEFNVNDLVQFKLDANANHWYVVLEVIQGTNQTPCVYNIELTTDSGMQFKGVPESYMTDTRDPNDNITPEASASS